MGTTHNLLSIFGRTHEVLKFYATPWEAMLFGLTTNRNTHIVTSNVLGNGEYFGY